MIGVRAECPTKQSKRDGPRTGKGKPDGDRDQKRSQAE
jgi:hypothetical protein